MKITLLTDNLKSWIIPYVDTLERLLKEKGHIVVRSCNASEIPEGDIAFFLSCEKIVSDAILARNTHNIVVHESALPQGKGWSPLTWQILEGKDEIPITFFEAIQAVDAGPIYLQDTMHFEGHELIDELRDIQGKKTIDLILGFVDRYPNVHRHPQEGGESFYRRRKSEDSELDIDKSIREQFNLLRVVDNDRYPAFFRYKNNIYILKIFKKQ